MNFSENDIRSACVGAERIEVTEAGFRFHRIPEKLVDRYNASEAGQIRMSCPSGVRLRFISNTRFLKIELKYGRSARQFFRGELRVDSTTLNAFGPLEETGTWEGEIFRQETQESRLFEVWLPHLAENRLVRLEAEDGAGIASAPAQSVRWLIYGDSITQGMTSALPTSSYTGRCACALDASTLNMGIGGEVFASEFAGCLPDFEWGLVSIAYGANDWAKNVKPDDMKANAGQLLDALLQRNPDAPVFLITPIAVLDRSDKNEFGISLNEYRAVLADAAGAFESVHVIDGIQLVPAEKKLFVDGVHPNDQGFEFYAGNLLKEINKVVRHRD